LRHDRCARRAAVGAVLRGVRGAGPPWVPVVPGRREDLRDAPRRRARARDAARGSDPRDRGERFARLRGEVVGEEARGGARLASRRREGTRGRDARGGLVRSATGGPVARYLGAAGSEGGGEAVEGGGESVEAGWTMNTRRSSR